MRFVPETANRADWARLVAQIVNGLVRREPDWANLQDFADDAAAAAGGVGLREFYRTGSIVKQRIT